MNNIERPLQAMVEPDIAKAVKEIQAKERRNSFSNTVNRILAAGLPVVREDHSQTTQDYPAL